MMEQNKPYIRKIDQVTYLPQKNQLALFLIGFIGFQLIGTLITMAFLGYGISIYGDNAELVTKFVDSAPVSMFVNSVSYVVIYLLCLLNSRIGIPDLLSKFKGTKPYLAALCAILAIFAFNFVYNAFLYTLNIQIHDNINEAGLNSIIKEYPIQCIFMFGILAPIVEELTYRVGLFSLGARKGKGFAYAITIIVFTIIHISFVETDIINELLNIPFYCFAAATFCFIYDKYGFAASVVAHVLNNFTSIILMVI